MAFAVLHIVAHHELYIVVKASYSPDVPKGFSNRSRGNDSATTAANSANTKKAPKATRGGGNGDAIEFVQSMSDVKATFYAPAQLSVIDKLKQTIHAANDVEGAMQ